MNQHQMQQHFQMIRQTVMKVCWLSVVSFVVFVVIIISPLMVLLILVSLLLRNLLGSVNTPESHSGVPVEVHSRRNFAMTLLGKSKKQLTQKT